MVRLEALAKRIEKLNTYLGVLKKLQRYSLGEFKGNPEIYGSAERFLQLAIECLNDMGNHLIADLDLGVVNWQSDIPEILFLKEYIKEEEKDRWTRMIGFRNLLVHDYLDIDRGRVYRTLQEDLSDIEEIGKVFVTLI